MSVARNSSLLIIAVFLVLLRGGNALTGPQVITDTNRYINISTDHLN
jgi:hypothetical protein